MTDNLTVRTAIIMLAFVVIPQISMHLAYDAFGKMPRAEDPPAELRRVVQEQPPVATLPPMPKAED